MRNERSKALLERAEKVIPGGVNSPVRAFRAVGGIPPFLLSGSGSALTDEDGNRYLDFVGSWGPLILGHAHPGIVEAVQKAAASGTSFGAPTKGEVELAELVCAAVPSVEMVRFVNSGTEATMSAVRLARAATGRDLIVKFDGNYHGHSDGLLVKAGSGATTFGVPDSNGVPEPVAGATVSIPYNDMQAVDQVFDKFSDSVAALIVEPVAANMGVIPPEPGFLDHLRASTSRHGALLIFDEVITGFRVGPSGAQGLYRVTPDITCLGKVVGGGLPVGAYGASADLMHHVAPLGGVYQAGTLSGNPLAMAAGLATLRVLKEDPPYKRLERLGQLFAAGLTNALTGEGLEVCCNRVGSLLTIFLRPGPVKDYEDARRSNTQAFARFHRAMLQFGIYLPPSQFEAMMLSAAHTEEDLLNAVDAARKAASSVVPFI